MLDAKLEPAVAEDEVVVSLTAAEEPVQAEPDLTDEELADEVVVEISVDGMCGVY